MPDKLLRFAAGGSVADGNGFNPILFGQLADGLVCRINIGHRRMRKYGGMFQQIAMPVKHHHLAAGAEPGVNPHHHLFAQRRRKQQLPHIPGKDADGLIVRLCLGKLPHFGLHMRLQKPLVGIPDSLRNQFGRFGTVFQMYAFQQRKCFILRRFHFNTQKTLLLATEHGQKTVGGHTGDRLLVVKIKFVFLPFQFLALHHFGNYTSLVGEEFAQPRPGQLMLRNRFGDDIGGTMQCGLHIRHPFFLIHKMFRPLARISVTLCVNAFRQRLQTLFTRNSGAGLPFRLIGQVKVLQHAERFSRIDFRFQSKCHLALLPDGLQDIFPPRLQFGQLFQPVTDGGDDHFVQTSGRLLAVTCDEGDARPLVQQFNGVAHRIHRQVQFLCDFYAEIHLLFFIG